MVRPSRASVSGPLGLSGPPVTGISVSVTEPVPDTGAVFVSGGGRVRVPERPRRAGHGLWTWPCPDPLPEAVIDPASRTRSPDTGARLGFNCTSQAPPSWAPVSGSTLALPWRRSPSRGAQGQRKGRDDHSDRTALTHAHSVRGPPARFTAPAACMPAGLGSVQPPTCGRMRS